MHFKRPQKNKKPLGAIRVIGGQWRGRKIPVIQAPGLRPTSDRLKETLFNWLQFDIAHQNILDLFAGSGGLGIEALSRGANQVTFVEKSQAATQQLQANLKLMQAQSFELYSGDALRFLQQEAKNQYSIVFIDPPFQQGLLADVLAKLEPWLAPHAYIYLEFESGLQLNNLSLPQNWRLHREKKFGESQAQLYQLTSEYT